MEGIEEEEADIKKWLVFINISERYMKIKGGLCFYLLFVDICGQIYESKTEKYICYFMLLNIARKIYLKIWRIIFIIFCLLV